MNKLQAYLRYLISVLLLFNLVHLAYGYEYADESRKAEIQQRVEELKSKIGSTYWILPNDRIRFYEKPTILAKYFCVTEAEGITITDWKSTNEIRPEIGSFYKVIFESGKVAFLQAETFPTSSRKFFYYGEFILTEAEKEARIKSEKEQADMQKMREKEQADMQKMREKERADVKKMIVTSFGDKLPPGYKGSDIKLIYERLRQKIPAKGKFEKTEEYEKRVQGIKISEVYAFLVDDEITIKYSPDDENLNVTITLFSIDCDDNIGISFQNRFISVKESSGRVTSYLASNAFGAKTTVKKYSGIMYGLYAVNSLQKDSYWPSLNLDVSLKVAEAKKHMNALKVLLIAVPDSYGKPLTLTFTGKYLAKPTFDSPVEFSYGVRGVNAEIVEIWLYNFKTGTILKKWEFY